MLNKRHDEDIEYSTQVRFLYHNITFFFFHQKKNFKLWFVVQTREGKNVFLKVVAIVRSAY